MKPVVIVLIKLRLYVDFTKHYYAALDEQTVTRLRQYITLVISNIIMVVEVLYFI